jgi:hypothetical protein
MSPGHVIVSKVCLHLYQLEKLVATKLATRVPQTVAIPLATRITFSHQKIVASPLATGMFTSHVVVASVLATIPTIKLGTRIP